MAKKLTTKNIIIGGVIILTILAIGLYTNTIKLSITRAIFPQYATDLSDDRKLMGASHNVFVGKVIKQIGNKSRLSAPKTQFEVEVIYNIKGRLSGSVVVDQMGGYKYGILYLVHGGDVVAPVNAAGDFDYYDNLFEPGMTYLFTTRYGERDDWYTSTSHPNGKKLISQDKSLNQVQLEALAKNDDKVVGLQEAYKNEILLDVDVKTNNTRNSYQKFKQE